MIKKVGFTLAEILIVLGIIGVIAALTIPNLIEKSQDIQRISALKKVYSTLTNAYTSAVQENGPPENWNVANSTDLMNNFLPYFRITKNCGTSNTNGCFAPTYTHLDNTSWANGMNVMLKVQLLDGSSVLFDAPVANCGLSRGAGSLATKNICSEMYVDINGPKGPNRVGVDLFFFYLTKYGIIPAGTRAETVYDFANHCYNSSGDLGVGFGCTAWVIYNQNMDYLHCKGLSWTGKQTCN